MGAITVDIEEPLYCQGSGASPQELRSRSVCAARSSYHLTPHRCQVVSRLGARVSRCRSRTSHSPWSTGRFGTHADCHADYCLSGQGCYTRGAIQLSYAAHEHHGHWGLSLSRFGLVIRVSSSTMLLSISQTGNSCESNRRYFRHFLLLY